ncbi:MAG: C40 family peptidase [Gammaproteobacteria bacterium]|nr:C40 family peptidase [Gammaproteobacteria bacterium]
MALQRSLFRVFLPVVGVLAAGLASCTSPPRQPEPTAAAAPERAGNAQVPDPVRSQVVFTAMQMVGVPYRWGGSTPAGFDCSGLVQYVYSHAGFRLPRTAAEQMDASAPVTLENAQAGDLLFFRDGGRTSHVAIYLGQGRFVHAPSTGSQVSLDSFGNSYWRMRFARAGRVAITS